MARTLAYIVCGAALLIGAALVLVTLLLTLAPPYAGITGVWDLGPLLRLAHFRYYLARTAILNTLLLLATVLPLSAVVAWVWQRVGMTHRVHPLLLVPLLLPGPVIALLWQPLFAPWLELGDTTLNLLITGLVLLWRSVPLLLLLLTLQGRAWRMGLGLAAILILLDGGLPLLLSGGAPYNAAHTWAGWILQQLWTNRAWGHAANLSAALALVVGMTVWFAQPHDTPRGAANHRANRLGAWLGLIWIAAPFLSPLWTVACQPVAALAALPVREAALWLLNSTVVTLLAASLALGLIWAWTHLPRTHRSCARMDQRRSDAAAALDGEHRLSGRSSRVGGKPAFTGDPACAARGDTRARFCPPHPTHVAPHLDRSGRGKHAARPGPEL